MKLDKYLRIPFKHMGRGFDGCDCIGLIYLWHKNENGVEIEIEDKLGTEYGTITDDRLKHFLLSIGSFSMFLDEGDILMFGDEKHVTHCGVYIGNGEFIHQLQSPTVSGLRNPSTGNIGGVSSRAKLNDWISLYHGAVKLR